MSIKYQRLIIIIFSLILIASAIFLILFNSKKNFVFFLTPTELISSDKILKEQIRIGGYIKTNSLIKQENNNYYEFIVTDKENEIKVKYSGILPDLFREGQGAVIEGKIMGKNEFLASRIFTKHDENYMPASIKKQLKQKNYWNKEY